MKNFSRWERSRKCIERFKIQVLESSLASTEEDVEEIEGERECGVAGLEAWEEKGGGGSNGEAWSDKVEWAPSSCCARAGVERSRVRAFSSSAPLGWSKAFEAMGSVENGGG